VLLALKLKKGQLTTVGKIGLWVSTRVWVGQTCPFQFQFVKMVRATGLIFGTKTGMGFFLRTGLRIYFYIPRSSFFCKNEIPIQHCTKYPSNTALNTHPSIEMGPNPWLLFGQVFVKEPRYIPA
jgi:hypothetical protein